MNIIIYLILSFILSFLLTSAVIPQIICIAFKKKWFDTLDARKIHHGLIPRVGGMAFVPSAIATCIMMLVAYCLLGTTDEIWPCSSSNFCLTSFVINLIALGLIYAEGLTDDIKDIGYKVKFMVHFLCAILVVASGIWINNFYGLFGLYEIPWFFGMPFTVLLIVYVINAINLIDGIDGLCSGLTMVAFLFLGSLFYIHGNVIDACLSFSMLGALTSYFWFNVYGKVEKRNKIFMGDCGSQVLGLLLSMLAVKYAMHQAEETSSGDALIVAFSLMIIPCLDVIRVTIGRISRGVNPFLPDKTHIHHLLLARGWSQRKARNFIIVVALFFVILNLLLDTHININIIFIADIMLYMLLLLWISKGAHTQSSKG